jgi:chemotaxis protein MotB
VSAPSNRRRRGDRGGGGHEGGDERWLLTYADMITLLMALFIVMWAISSTNITKFKELKQSLNQAFSGKIIAGDAHVLTGGAQILQEGSQGKQGSGQSFFNPQEAMERKIKTAAAKRDTENLHEIQEKIQSYARSHGFSALISTRIDERGLVVRLLTDKVLFAVGSATLQPQALPLLDEISKLLVHAGIINPIRVEGNTDDRPISSPQFPSNWELSTARATAVLEVLLASGVSPHRLSVAGYADQRPIATNATDAGRARNRHVDLVVLRRTVIQGGSG